MNVMHNVAQDIINSYDQRRAAIATLIKDDVGRRKEAEVALSHTKNELSARRKSLFHNLSTADNERLQQATKDSAQRQAEDKQRQAAEKRRRAVVVSFLKEKQADRLKMSKELNHMLSVDMQKVKAGEKKRQASSAAMLNELRVEIGGYTDGWHDLTAAMQARRGSIIATPPRVNGATKKAALPDSKLSSAIFEFIASNPDGIETAALEKEFKIGKKQLENLVNGMVKSANIKKRGKRFFST